LNPNASLLSPVSMKPQASFVYQPEAQYISTKCMEGKTKRKESELITLRTGGLARKGRGNAAARGQTGKLWKKHLGRQGGWPESRLLVLNIRQSFLS